MPEPETRARVATARLRAAADTILIEVRALPPELITWIRTSLVVMDKEHVQKHLGQIRRNVSAERQADANRPPPVRAS